MLLNSDKKLTKQLAVSTHYLNILEFFIICVAEIESPYSVIRLLTVLIDTPNISAIWGTENPCSINIVVRDQ